MNGITMRLSLAALAVSLSAMISGPQVAAAPMTDEAAIRAAREQSNRAIARKDLDAFARTLAADFVMVRGSGAFVASRQAYLDLFRDDFANPAAITYKRMPEKIEMSSAAPLAAEHGRWVGANVDGTVAYRGTYLAMWRRTGTGWEIRSELFVVLSCGVGDACKSYAAGTSFIVAYRVRPNRVEVLAVLHGARRWPETL